MTNSKHSFYSAYSKLTNAQFEVIGRVASYWSLVEYALERILIRLALSPDFPGMALTNDLGLDNRLKALKNLIEIHAKRYNSKIIPDETLDTLLKIRTEVARLKSRRNRIIHYVWFRRDDKKMFGIRFRGKVPTNDSQGGNFEILRLSEASSIAAKIDNLGSRMIEIARELPETNEASPNKSPLQIRRNPQKGR